MANQDNLDLMNMRDELYDLIVKVNQFISRTDSRSIERDIAFDVRGNLIQADNVLNGYRLRHTEDRK